MKSFNILLSLIGGNYDGAAVPPMIKELKFLIRPDLPIHTVYKTSLVCSLVSLSQFKSTKKSN